MEDQHFILQNSITWKRVNLSSLVPHIIVISVACVASATHAELQQGLGSTGFSALQGFLPRWLLTALCLLCVSPGPGTGTGAEGTTKKEEVCDYRMNLCQGRARAWDPCVPGRSRIDFTLQERGRLQLWAIQGYFIHVSSASMTKVSSLYTVQARNVNVHQRESGERCD